VSWFVYWNCGWCGDGDHDCGLEEYQDEELALAEYNQRRKLAIEADPAFDGSAVRLICGEEQ
jgi:hypothetical protein